MRIIKNTILPVMLLWSIAAVAQENILLNRSFWKKQPDLKTIQQKITEGNDPAQLNKNAFDAVIYALLEKSDDEVVKYLLSLDGNPIDKKTHDSRIYLHWAAYAGQTEIVNYLLEKGSSTTALDSHGYTPLAFAANAGQKNPALYDSFENHGVNLLDEKNENGANLLLLVAPYLSNETELNYFLDKGFDLDSKDAIGNGIFNHAAKQGNIAFLNLLVEKGVDYKTPNEKGGNAVLYASFGTRNSSYDIAVFRYLEKLGIPENVVGDYGRNPLHRIAYKSNDIALYQYFIDHGVAVDVPDNDGISPFMNAASRNDLEVVKFLSQHVKDINAQDKNGRSALAMAVSRNSPEVVEFLLSKNAEVKITDTQNNTLAYYLLNTYQANDSRAFEAKLTLLLDHGFTMNQPQQQGNTLLHLAALKNDLTLLQRLESFDIDINATNVDGYTALQIAAMKAHSSDILKYLIDHGADKTIKTDFEETVLDLASENEMLKQQNTNLNFLQ